MKRIVVALAAALLCGAAGKLPGPLATVRFYGAGNDSCAHWLSSHTTREEGITWMMGFWSGLNVSSTKNHLVGNTTDGDAIVAETKLTCEKKPSTNLNEAVGEVYYRFQQEGK